jgi:enoyl-CoA hydratase/carnithine racemase
MGIDEAVSLLDELVAAAPGGGGAVRLARRDGVAELVIDHPRAHNAFTASMMRDLALGVRALVAEPASVVVVRSSTPGMFCSGGHLGEVRRSLVDPDAARRMSRGFGAALDALSTLPSIVVALVDGAAIGGGVEVALAADLRVMTARGSIELRQARLGVAAGWGGARRLVRLVGPGRALSLLVAAERLGPEQAIASGLVERVVTDGDGAAAWVEELARRPRAALTACKRQVFAANAEAETEAFLSVWGGSDHLEALGQPRVSEA